MGDEQRNGDQIVPVYDQNRDGVVPNLPPAPAHQNQNQPLNALPEAAEVNVEEVEAEVPPAADLEVPVVATYRQKFEKRVEGGVVRFSYTEALLFASNSDWVFPAEDTEAGFPFFMKMVKTESNVDPAREVFTISREWSDFVSKYNVRDGDIIEFSVPVPNDGQFCMWTERKEGSKLDFIYFINVYFRQSCVSLIGQHPISYLATASSDNTVKIWNVDGFTLEKTLVGHQCWVWDCVFSVDGAFLITASSDSTARLWSMATGEEIKVYRGHQKATVCCALHDGTEPS